ncbi:MAG: hypothetical protein ACKOE6_09165 [Flammeovirgaceae bacterium]
MRIKLLQVLLVVAILPACKSWAQAKIDFSQILLSVSDNTWDAKDRSFVLENGKSVDNVFILTNDRKISLSVMIKMRRMKSRISQHKAQGIRLQLKYKCQFEGSVSKNKTERVFWPDNDGNFKESVTFNFNNGKLKPIVGTLQYQAKVTLN